MNASEIQHLQEWIGRTETRSDLVTPVPIAALAATLDRDDPAPLPGDPLPPLWHWLYFLPLHRQSELGPDGHPNRGGFLPPVSLPRRMWAGGRLEFLQPLRVGENITRVSRIVSVTHKQGRTGELVFVLVRHEISNDTGLALTEEHDIVYRGPGESAQTPPTAPTDGSFRRTIIPDDVLLFRYSALTFNGHRIHYDRRYVTEEEHYPGLVVHGPLMATLLVDLLRQNHPSVKITKFDFRAVSPVYDVASFRICGKPEGDGVFKLWVSNEQGGLAMDATAITASV